MALIAYELLIVGAIVLILLLWAPKKLLELAKSLGLARKESKKASQEQADTGESTSKSRRKKPSSE